MMAEVVLIWAALGLGLALPRGSTGTKVTWTSVKSELFTTGAKEDWYVQATVKQTILVERRLSLAKFEKHTYCQSKNCEPLRAVAHT